MGRNSYDSGQRPLSDVHYQSANNPYGDPNYNNSGYVQQRKRPISKWIKIGIPVLIVIIIAAVVGGVVASKHKSDNANSSSGGGSGGSGGKGGSNGAGNGRFATATDTYGLPIYPSETNTAEFTIPTFTNNAAVSWPQDPFQPANPDPATVRTDRPRLIAPAYKWAALPGLIAQDPYLKGWNDTIFGNATFYYSQPPVPYVLDGGVTGSGALDVARQVKERVKAWAYAYRMTNDTKWMERLWTELQHAAANGTDSFGTAPDNWNSQHFLDLAEFTAAFAIGYDWLHDAWSDDRRTAIMWSIINLGLSFGISGYATGSSWWTATGINGNWNCVCNSGLTMGALAILGDDPTGSATAMLAKTVPNAASVCTTAPSGDGTWSETANYWYFGTTGHAEMSSSLLTATGGDYGLITNNPNFNATGLYHMYVTGMTSLFNYGDHGPNKYSTTANAMFLYSTIYNAPVYALFQRDRIDAADPWSMFWYDPNISGAFWDQMPLDHGFTNATDSWASMRSSWTDNDGMYIAMKASVLVNHQTHGDLDCGDFVLDAMGQRWAGELGSGDYLSTGYFSNETQDSDRWLYYRKRTEGQNTLVLNKANQLVTAAPTTNFASSGTVQGSSTVLDVSSDSTAYFWADISSAYTDATIKRGIRFLSGRQQVLLQDEITCTQPIQWRMHTNATVDASGTSATLTLSGKTLTVQIVDAPTGATFATGPAVRDPADPALPPGMVDQPNPGVTVLSIALQAGTYTLQVLFTPHWAGVDVSSFATPPTVSLANWSLTSHK